MPRTSTVMSLLLIFILKGLMPLSTSLVAATMIEVSYITTYNNYVVT